MQVLPGIQQISTARYNCNLDQISHSSSLVSQINCAALIQGLEPKWNMSHSYMKAHINNVKSDSEVLAYSSNCTRLSLTYITCSASDEEMQYPIAYSILCHKDAAQVERLLRTIYQPQNVYCLHLDKKANHTFHKALENIANCFPNVFVASKLESVVYASYALLQADLNCMQDLLMHPEQRRYLINLVGQAFPLKTNREIMNILKIYNGANDLEGLALDRFIRERVSFLYTIKKIKHTERLVRSELKEEHNVPGNLTLVRGSAYGVFS